MAETAPAYKVIASPQPGPQTAFVACPIFEILYGGARGGGKTMAVLIKWAVHASEFGKQARGIIFRRERVNLVDMIKEAHAMYGPLGATWKEQDKEYTMPGGGTLRFAYIESDKDAEAYQGHNYNFIGIEELTQFPDPAPINKLKATLRGSVRCQFVATANPGGPGHHWVKARYIDPAPEGFKIIEEDFAGVTMQRIFIPAKLKDNRYLVENDPTYVARLRMSGSEQLVRAWLDGDWNVIEGAYFSEFGLDHIVAPFEIPSHWTRYRALDWGSYRPFCVLWFAVSDGTIARFPKGALVVYREWYGWNGKANEGCKMIADDVSLGVLAREDADEKITFSVADPSIFKRDGGPSIGERMSNSGTVWIAGDNTRVIGWNEVRRRLQGEEGTPSLFFFSTCTHIIRTLPALQHDTHKPEDVDTDGEDHAPDTLRYGVMARYGVKAKPVERPPGILAKDVFKVRPKSDRI